MAAGGRRRLRTTASFPGKHQWGTTRGSRVIRSFTQSFAAAERDSARSRRGNVRPSDGKSPAADPTSRLGIASQERCNVTQLRRAAPRTRRWAVVGYWVADWPAWCSPARTARSGGVDLLLVGGNISRRVDPVLRRLDPRFDAGVFGEQVQQVRAAEQLKWLACGELER